MSDADRSPDDIERYVELTVPSDLDEATRQYEWEAVVYAIVNITAEEADENPTDVLRSNLGDTLRVPPEPLGLIEHDTDLEQLGWPSNVRTVDTGDDR